MARAFKYTRKGITGSLETAERELLAKLFKDVQSLIEPDAEGESDPLAAMVGIDDDVTVPDDDAVRRLLPDGARDDVEALEFRRLTERSLRESKTAVLRAAELIVESDPLVLNEEQASTLTRALNDVRLVLGQRLEIENDDDADRLHQINDWSEATDLQSYLAVVYNFLTWLQNSLTEALLRGMR